ncbi:MAG: Rossmann fold nucleotide-binding protein Smf possibly involved in DNA uptake [uncultured Sulfurovum sp.]|uniref:Rossmann fold nucleotide-binding protein Smf possibly involved in DNA uptake n=1 Tax=uncultured Sulfurovum sp. TaxID=269237 RepID=A0A6S6TZ79_9BACT|nr:MAG: Rossmann fold nucleotide-binding protein Smf possibly involved in DNA uptake [uncultured Sulfurovum sp.]
MICSENVINILTAKSYKGIGRAWIVKNLKGNESVHKIIDLLNKDSKEKDEITIENFSNIRNMIKGKIRKLESSIDGVVALGDDTFPKYRGEVKNSEQPIVIFYKGNLNLLSLENKNIAVIGLLDADNNIEKVERTVVSQLVNQGATIVSGLALGCDSIAHQEALDSHGNTIAILPSALNDIVPASNKKLANDIIANNGLLITEYYEEVKSKSESNSRFQERDRLQALFSDAIILSASYSKDDSVKDSGARLAMQYALNYSIPRAVIYNLATDIDNQKYNLNRQLINDDNDITIISQENLFSTVQKILSSELNKDDKLTQGTFSF